MQPFADDNALQVFIVRIWREPREIPGAAPEWRGVVEHVPSGKRHYLKDLDEITHFIIPYLSELGLSPSLGLRFKYWWGKWKHRRS